MEDEALTELIAVLPLRELPSQKRSRRKVFELLDAALTVVGRDGPEALTTANVAAEAGAPIGTVYRYFHDREWLIEALIVMQRYEMDTVLLARFKTLVLAKWRGEIRALVADLTAFARARPTYLALHTLAQGRSVIRNPAIAHRWVENIIQSPALSSTGVEPRVARLHATVLVAGIQGMIPQFYTAAESELDAMIDAAARMVTLYIDDVARELGISLP